MDRRGFLRVGAGSVALAMLPLSGCATDDLPPVTPAVGPTEIAADGTRFELRPREHALVISGTTERRVGGVGAVPGKLNFPIGLALAGGLAHVVDCGNHRISVFDPTGASVAVFGGSELLYPGGIAAFEDELFVADSRHARIVVFDLAGRVTRVLGAGVLSAPRGLAMRGDVLLVADPGLRQVLELDRAGAVRRTVGTAWVLPYDVASDGTRVFVADAAAAELAVIEGNVRRRAVPLDASPSFVSLASDGTLYTG